VIYPVTSPCIPEAAAAATPELVLAAGLCAVGLVAAVVTVVPSVTPLGLINAPLVPVGGEALELLLSAGTQEVVAFCTVAVPRGVAAPALVAAAGDVAVGVTLCPSVHALHAPPLPAPAVRAPPLVTVFFVSSVDTLMAPITSQRPWDAGAVATPELVVAAGLFAVCFVSVVTTLR